MPADRLRGELVKAEENCTALNAWISEGEKMRENARRFAEHIQDELSHWDEIGDSLRGRLGDALKELRDDDTGAAYWWRSGGSESDWGE